MNRTHVVLRARLCARVAVNFKVPVNMSIDSNSKNKEKLKEGTTKENNVNLYSTSSEMSPHKYFY